MSGRISLTREPAGLGPGARPLLTVRVTPDEFERSERLYEECRLPDGSVDHEKAVAGMRRIFGGEVMDFIAACAKPGEEFPVRVVVK
jgi:hypothetical protein